MNQQSSSNADWAIACMKIRSRSGLSAARLEQLFLAGNGSGRLWRLWQAGTVLARAATRGAILQAAADKGWIDSLDASGAALSRSPQDQLARRQAWENLSPARIPPKILSEFPSFGILRAPAPSGVAPRPQIAPAKIQTWLSNCAASALLFSADAAHHRSSRRECWIGTSAKSQEWKVACNTVRAALRAGIPESLVRARLALLYHSTPDGMKAVHCMLSDLGWSPPNGNAVGHT